MQPTIGRIVHYRDELDKTWPAIIISIDGPDMKLRVFDESNMLPIVNTPIKKGMARGPILADRGNWWWPERL